jgi:hypothetical protein
MFMESERRLSPGQQRLWFLEQLNEAKGLYNEYACARISGPLNVPAMYQALMELTRRHESLRWVVKSDQGTCVATVRKPSGPDWLVTIHLGEIAEPEERERLYRHYATQATRRPFDLAAGPLWRVLLFRVSRNKFALTVVMHHIISDGWSMQILVEDLCQTYCAMVLGKPLSPTCANYVSGSGHEIQHSDHLQYWVTKLANSPPAVSLPVHRRWPAVRTFVGKKQYFTFNEDISALIRTRIREANATPFIYLLTLWTAYLGMSAGSRDLVIGTTTDGRSEKGTERLIGFFVNTLAIRTEIRPSDSFAEYLKQVRAVSLEALDHRGARFEQVVRALNLPRLPNRQPLFEVMFIYVNMPVLALRLPDVEVRLTPEDVTLGLCKFDLVISFWEDGSFFRGLIDYSLELYDPSEINTHVNRFLQFATRAVENSDYLLRQLIAGRQTPNSIVEELQSS